MTDQLTLNLTAGRAARDDALDRVEHAAGDWNELARAAVTVVAHAQPELISDDVWNAGLPAPREGRALGPVMLWAQRAGLITPTGTFRPTAKPNCHAAPVRVWTSNVYRP